MKSALYFIFILSLIFLACSTDKKEEAATDSTLVAVDTTQASSASTYHPGPARNFPSFSPYALTENELEISITDALADLLNQYDTGEYRTIRSDYLHYYKVPTDYDSMEASESETKTWYFNRDNQLKAYTVVYEEKIGSSVSDPNSGSSLGTSHTIIYLFSASSAGSPTLIGVYDDKVFSDQVAVNSRERIAISKCPQCGISMSYENEPTNELEILNEDYVSGLSDTFLNEYNFLVENLKGAEAQRSGDGYLVQEEHVSTAGTPYTLSYYVDQSFFDQFLKATNP